MNPDFMQGIRQNAYFNSLPPSVQESVIESSVEIQSEDQLRKLAQTLIGSEPKG